jgi:hypothetical protein
VRARRVGETHGRGGIVAGQEPVAQRSAERVAGTEAVHDLDPDRRHHLAPLLGGHKDALAAQLHDGQARAEGQERRGSALRLELADSDRHLGSVPHDDARMPKRRSVTLRRGGRVGPQHRPPVEVEDRRAVRPAQRERLHRRRQAGVVREPRAGGPEDRRVADRLGVEVLDG